MKSEQKNLKQVLGSILILIVTIFAMSFTFTLAAEAQSAEQLACEGTGGVWDGSNCNSTDPDATPIFGSDSLFETIVNTLIFLVGAISVIMLVIGGIRYVISAGDSNAVQGAKNTILYAIVGIVIAVSAYGIVRFVISSLSS